MNTYILENYIYCFKITYLINSINKHAQKMFINDKI